jgi:hypothetical protein
MADVEMSVARPAASIVFFMVLLQQIWCGATVEVRLELPGRIRQYFFQVRNKSP